jgi:hypothetical protein
MTITGHPLHRSGRALLTHPAPVLGQTTSMNTNRMQVSATGRPSPALSPGRAARAHIPLDQPPSLHLLRADLRHQFVRRLRRYYAAVRLPAPVHHRRTSLDFSMRPKLAAWLVAGSPGSRASCFHACLGSPTARNTNGPCQCGPLIVAFPFPKQGRHPELCPFSRLNTQPTLPLSTLRRMDYSTRRMTRGRYGWLNL